MIEEHSPLNRQTAVIKSLWYAKQFAIEITLLSITIILLTTCQVNSAKVKAKWKITMLINVCVSEYLSYCSSILSSVPNRRKLWGVYLSLTACQRYCTLRSWTCCIVRESNNVVNMTGARNEWMNIRTRQYGTEHSICLHGRIRQGYDFKRKLFKWQSNYFSLKNWFFWFFKVRVDMYNTYLRKLISLKSMSPILWQCISLQSNLSYF